MPDLHGMGRLWHAWHDAGRASGAEPLLWTEIDAFSRIEGLSRGDAVTLRHMSQAYIEGLMLTQPLAIMPMDLDDEE